MRCGKLIYLGFTLDIGSQHVSKAPRKSGEFNKPKGASVVVFRKFLSNSY